jgi:hypothetical protein
MPLSQTPYKHNTNILQTFYSFLQTFYKPTNFLQTSFRTSFKISFRTSFKTSLKIYFKNFSFNLFKTNLNTSLKRVTNYLQSSHKFLKTIISPLVHYHTKSRDFKNEFLCSLGTLHLHN